MAVAYPDDLLSDDEDVIVHYHPHWKVLIRPVLLLAVAVGVGAYLATLVAGQSWHAVALIAIAVVVVVVVLWFTVGPLIRWRTTHFIVTTERVMAREGVLRRTGIDIPLWRVNSVQFRHGLIDRVFGCGTLVIESASEAPLEFDDIPAVEYVQTVLYREMDAVTHARQQED